MRSLDFLGKRIASPARVLSVACMLFSLLAVGSCLLPDDGDWETVYRQIQVDSLSVPQAISAGDTLFVRFYGYLGFCEGWHFSHFDIHRATSTLTVSLWAEHRHRKDVEGWWALPSAPYMDGEVLTVADPRMGTFFLVVEQPDASLVVDSVLVLDGREILR